MSAAPNLDLIARQLRLKLVQMSHAASSPHLGSALSCVDILVAAYWNVLRIDVAKPAEVCRDRFILSKGHAATALYATLAERGFFPKAWLESFAEHRAPLAEQPAPNCAPGVELATGSLGHGLSVGVGMLTLGQYLQPTPRSLEVQEYVTPEKFQDLKRKLMAMGFENVLAGSYVRSSYHARETFTGRGDERTSGISETHTGI